MGQGRILILDDEPFQLQFLSHQLANLGEHAVDACGSGLDAGPDSGASYSFRGGEDRTNAKSV